jgi:hypothetical protein
VAKHAKERSCVESTTSKRKEQCRVVALLHLGVGSAAHSTACGK